MGLERGFSGNAIPRTARAFRSQGSRRPARLRGEVAIHTATSRKSRENRPHAVGRGTAREGAPLHGKCHQSLLVYFDFGSQKVTPEVTPDRGHGLPHAIQIRELRVCLTLNVKYKCARWPKENRVTIIKKNFS